MSHLQLVSTCRAVENSLSLTFGSQHTYFVNSCHQRMCLYKCIYIYVQYYVAQAILAQASRLKGSGGTPQGRERTRPAELRVVRTGYGRTNYVLAMSAGNVDWHGKRLLKVTAIEHPRDLWASTLLDKSQSLHLQAWVGQGHLRSTRCTRPQRSCSPLLGVP